MTSLKVLQTELNKALQAYDYDEDNTRKNDYFWLMDRILARMVAVSDSNKDVNPLEMLLSRICVVIHDVIPLLWKYYARIPPEKSPNRRRPTSEDWKAGIYKIVDAYNLAQGAEGLQKRRLLLAALGLLMVHVEPDVYQRLRKTDPEKKTRKRIKRLWGI